MRRRLVAGIVAGAVSGAAVALLQVLLRIYAGVPTPAELIADRTLPLLPVSTFLQVLGLLGGPIAAKELAFWGGFAGVVVAGAGVGAAWSVVSRRARARAIGVAVVILVLVGLLAALTPVLEASYLGLPPVPAAVVAALALILAVVMAAGGVATLVPVASGHDAGRRQLLLTGATLLLLGAAGGFAARLFQDGAFGYDGLRLRGPMRKPVTPVSDFYAVTKNLVDPDVDPALWRLEVGGAVRSPFTLTIDELRRIGGETQETTLECISNGVGYGLLSNGLWGGVAMRTLVARAAPLPEATFAVLESVDGYRYSVPLSRVLDGDAFVAHSMNGEPLVRRHGAPARAIIPGAYGEASAKWLTRITLVDADQPGYYELQGWQAEHVHTTSVIDSPPNRSAVPRSPQVVRGVAFAGDRGISRVEISADGGGTWSPARIDYSQSPLAWALWSADWTPAGPGPATLTVRAYDGTGAMQEAAPHGTVPAGASGLHRVVVQVA